MKENTIKKITIKKIVHCIVCHRFRNNHIPETIEAKIIYDSDKLDSIGAVGIGRAFWFSGDIKSRIYTGNEKRLAKVNKNYSYTKEDSALLEYEVKLKFIKNKLFTKTAKIIAEKRNRVMEFFWKEFF